MTKSDFPENLAKPAKRALEGAGYFHLEQVAQLSEKELLMLHGMGAKAISQLRQAFMENGLTFSNES
jgi:hypothetical protein